jgi:hypothetical protein
MVYATLDFNFVTVRAAQERLDADPNRVRSPAEWSWTDAAIQQLPAAHASAPAYR